MVLTWTTDLRGDETMMVMALWMGGTWLSTKKKVSFLSSSSPNAKRDSALKHPPLQCDTCCQIGTVEKIYNVTFVLLPSS